MNLRKSEWRALQDVARQTIAEGRDRCWPLKGWGGLYRRLFRRGLVAVAPDFRNAAGGGITGGYVLTPLGRSVLLRHAIADHITELCKPAKFLVWPTTPVLK